MIVKVQAMYRAETAILNAEQEEMHNETSFVVSKSFKILKSNKILSTQRYFLLHRLRIPSNPYMRKTSEVAGMAFLEKKWREIWLKNGLQWPKLA